MAVENFEVEGRTEGKYMFIMSWARRRSYLIWYLVEQKRGINRRDMVVCLSLAALICSGVDIL